MGLTYIKLFVDYLDAIEPLGDAERGRLFTALLTYAKLGAAEKLDGNERFIFPMMRAQIDRDAADMENYSKKQSENGAKGGRPQKPKKPTAFFENPKNPPLFLKTQKSHDKDKDKEEDKEKDKEKDDDKRESKHAQARFTPPTVEEVSAYCLERKNCVDAQRFVDFYASKGWKVGSQSMRDWKAAVRTWERRDGTKPKADSKSWMADYD